MMPMVLAGGQVFEGSAHALAILNTSNATVTLNQGTLLGKLYLASSIPDEVELIDTFDDVMEHLMTIYHHGDAMKEGPSLFEGPVYVPTPSTTNTIRVNTMSCPPLSNLI